MWRMQTIPADSRLPFQIADQSREVWLSYASLEISQRTLYPNCPHLKMKD